MGEVTMRHGFCELLCVSLLALSTSALSQQIRGDYIETRSADVYTGQCFANGEVNLVGDEAILAWHIQSGSWDGVPLDGLTVAAAVHANATLGDPYANPYPARAVLIVDDQATQDHPHRGEREAEPAAPGRAPHPGARRRLEQRARAARAA